MNKKILFLALALTVLFNYKSLKAQNIIYQNDFSSSAGWNLGTANNFDTWAVNNIYNCSTPTPNQGSGSYLHITDDLNGEYCASAVLLGLGSGGQCYATMNTGVNTVGLSSLYIQFDWLCAGQTGPVLATFGTLDYSIDGGLSWLPVSNPVSQFNGQSSWTNTTISSVVYPNMLNQPDLRLRFGFTNSGYGLNPAFAIDNLVIADGITTGNLSIQSENEIYLTPIDVNYYSLNINPSVNYLFQILNLSGQKMEINSVKTGNELLIDLSQQTTGIYILNVFTEKGVYNYKLFKQ